MWTRELTPEEWAAEISETYEYVYVYRSHDAFAQTYGQLFESGAEGIHDKTLYRVAYISDAIVLRPVSP